MTKVDAYKRNIKSLSAKSKITNKIPKTSHSHVVLIFYLYKIYPK